MTKDGNEPRAYMRDYIAELSSNCQSFARCLTYNGSGHEATAKHLLIEASRALDSHAVRVKDGVLVNARGKARRMTLRERMARWMLGGRLEIRP